MRTWRNNLIINADDFGRSESVNTAIAQSWESGVLTSTSLMVTGDAADQAVRLARSTPNLAVGLHLALTSVQPARPPRRLSQLIDRSTGRFRHDAAAVGWRIFWSKTARRQAADEIAAQFDRFAQTGLKLSHVDGHEHLHMHPVVVELVLPLAQQYGAAGIRLVREPMPWRDPTRTWRTTLRQISYAGIFACLGAWGRHALQKWPGLFAPDHTCGLMHSGQMTEPVVLNMLEQIQRDSHCHCVEMYFHPAVGARLDELGPNPGDLQTLLSPRMKQAIIASGFTLTTYPAAAAMAHSNLLSKHLAVPSPIPISS